MKFIRSNKTKRTIDFVIRREKFYRKFMYLILDKKYSKKLYNYTCT